VYELKTGLCEQRAVKYNLTALATFIKSDDEESSCEQHFGTKQQILLESTNISEQLNSLISRIEVLIDEFIKNGSGWVLNEIKFVGVCISKYSPFRGSSYIPLPE
jgi:hypothetical protein